MKQINEIKTISKDLTSVGYLGSCAIDPDIKIADRISGMICPSNYEKVLDKKDILWLEPNDINTDIYYYTAGGEFGKINNKMEATVISELDDSTGNGIKYYNNYYYIAVGEDIHRYGPIDGTPTLEENWWSNLSEKESFFKILTKGGQREINSTTKKISQSISSLINLSKLKIIAKSTNTNKEYTIRARIYEKETITKDLPEPFATPFARYDVDIPTGEHLLEATVSGETLTDEFDAIVFEFEETLTPSGFVVIIDTTEDLEANQSFEIMCSEFGDVYTGGLMAYYDTEWRANETKYDNDTSSHLLESLSVPGKTYTLVTKKEDAIIDKPVTVRFIISSGSATSWFIYLQVKRDGVSSLIPAAHFEATQAHQSTISVWENKSSDLRITIKPSYELQDGDIIELYGTGIDGDSQPANPTITRSGTSPYVFFIDTTSEEDMAMEIFAETISGNTLTDKTYPTIGKYKIPNHTMFESSNVIYIADTQDNRGVVHSFMTSTSMKLKDVVDSDFQFGDVIRGQNSRATATIVKVEESLSGGGVDISLGINKVYGVFEEDEVVKSLTRDGEATVESVTTGEMTLLSEMNRLFLDIEEEPVGFADFSSHIAVLTNKQLSRLRLWDGIAEDPYKPIPLSVPLATAITNHNGSVYAWGGDSDGYSISIYRGGDYVEQVVYVDNGLMPLMGAIGKSFNRLSWGSSQEYPEERGCVWAIGSRTEQSGWHNIASAGGQVSSLLPRVDDSSKIIATDDGIFLRGGDYDSIWRSEMMSFGRPFTINKVIIPLSRELVKDDKITVILHYDNETKQQEYEVEVGTYDDEIIKIEPESEGIFNFFIEIKIETETFVAAMLPIIITYTINE